MRRVLRTPSPPPWEGQVKTLQSLTGPLSASATLALVWDCNPPGSRTPFSGFLSVRGKATKLQASGVLGNGVVAG